MHEPTLKEFEEWTIQSWDDMWKNKFHAYSVEDAHLYEHLPYATKLIKKFREFHKEHQCAK